MRSKVLEWLKETNAPTELIELHIRREAQFRLFRDFYFANMAIAPVVQATIEATRNIIEPNRDAGGSDVR